MNSTLLAMLLGAGLFVLYGLLPHRGCTGHCAGCTGTCGRGDAEGEDHVR